VVVTKPVIDSDELTAFISATLKAIAAGVGDAADQVAVLRDDFVYSFEMPENVSFDLAVSAKRNTSTGGGLKVQIASIISGDARVSHDDGGEEISRISFEIGWKAVDRVEARDFHARDRLDELNEND